MFNNIISNFNLKKFWFFSYLSVLLLPFLVFSFNYNETYNLLKKEVNNTNYQLLEQVQKVIDSYIDDFNNITVNLRMNNKVEALKLSKQANTKQYYYSIYELKNELHKYTLFNNIIDNIYLYLIDSQRIISNNNTYDLNLLNCIQNEKLSIHDWNTISSTKLKKGYALLGKPQVNQLMLTSSLQESKNYNLIQSVITFNENKLISHIKNNLATKNASICILDNQNNLILSTDENTSANFDFSLINNSDTRFPLLGNNNINYIATSIASKECDWLYLYIVPEKIYSEKLKYVINKMIINLILCISIGITVIFLYSKLNYMPIKKLLFYVKHNFNNTTYTVDEKNEFNTILKTLKNNCSEIKQQRQVQRNSILSRIVKGYLDYNMLNKQTLKKLELQFDHENFIIGIIHIKDMGVFNTTDKQYYISEINTLRFAICNILNELSGNKNIHCTYGIVDSQIIYIFNFNKNINILTDIYDILSTLINFCKNKFNTTLLATYSDIILQINNISNGYNKALTAMQYIQLFNTYNILCANKLPIDNTENLTENNYLINLVLIGNRDKFQDILDESYNRISKSNNPILEAKYFIYTYYKLTTSIKQQLIIKYKEYPKEIDTIKNVFQTYSLNDNLILINTIYNTIFQFIKDNNNESYNINISICNYLDNNYIDNNLNVNTIAEYFNYTPAYLSKNFKTSIGISIMDYLYNVRIKKAKELLKDSNLRITEIATIVGFIDSNALIRIFKKKEGITPGMYKKNCPN